MDPKTFIFFCFLFNCATCIRTKDMIYEPLTGAATCIRRLNGTHQFGCTSARAGNVGIMYFITSDSDIKWLEDYGTRSPYIAILDAAKFDWNTIDRLKNSGKVNGILLLSNATSKSLNTFSHEDVCPNRYSGLSSLSSQVCTNETAWNPDGTRLLLQDISLPIFYISDSERISKIRACYEKHNVDIMNPNNVDALCALELKSFMFAAVDTQTCYRRSSLITTFTKTVKYCDPLGDHNVIYTVYPRSRHSSEKDGSVIVIASRLDSTSVFDGISPGALSPLTGAITLIATAALLSEMMFDIPTSGKNVMFVLFQGESYDYIGSSRMLWDMKQRRFPYEVNENLRDQSPPFEMKHVGVFVELDQILNSKEKGDEGKLYFYHKQNKTLSSNSQLQKFLENMALFGKEYNLNLVNGIASSIPPSSLQTFLAENETFPGAVLAGYKDRYRNRFYHSIYDDKENIDYQYYNGSLPPLDSVQSLMANVSMTLALTLHSVLTNNEKFSYDIKHGANMIDELLHCFLESLDCHFFNASSYVNWRLKKPDYYVGVSVSSNPLTYLSGNLISYFTGTKVANGTKSECKADTDQQVYSFVWLDFKNSTDFGNISYTGACVNTTVKFTPAVSPAFEIEEYDWSSGKYSTWTESVWEETSIRMFLKPSRGHDILILCLGIVVLILSFSISYFASTRAHILFPAVPPSRRTL